MTLPATILDPSHAAKFVEFFRLIQTAIHKVNVGNGWFDTPDADYLKQYALSGEAPSMVSEKLMEISKKLASRNDGEMIALMHSELSEALEGYRHGNPPSDHISEFSALEEEMADVVIRVMDYAQARNLNVAMAIIRKLEFNAGRGYKHGGKAC
jgi:NTP pyrophosphatase (non-canonical NTP hydrolase)